MAAKWRAEGIVERNCIGGAAALAGLLHWRGACKAVAKLGEKNWEGNCLGHLGDGK